MSRRQSGVVEASVAATQHADKRNRVHELVQRCLALSVTEIEGYPVDGMRDPKWATRLERAIERRRSEIIVKLRHRGYRHTNFDHWSDQELLEALAGVEGAQERKTARA